MLEHDVYKSRKLNITAETLKNDHVGRPYKYQRFGSSNNFVKVAAWKFCRFFLYKNNRNESTNHCSNTHANLSMLLLDIILSFENMRSNKTCSYVMITDVT